MTKIQTEINGKDITIILRTSSESPDCTIFTVILTETLEKICGGVTDSIGYNSQTRETLIDEIKDMAIASITMNYGIVVSS